MLGVSVASVCPATLCNQSPLLQIYEVACAYNKQSVTVSVIFSRTLSIIETADVHNVLLSDCCGTVQRRCPGKISLKQADKLGQVALHDAGDDTYI